MESFFNSTWSEKEHRYLRKGEQFLQLSFWLFVDIAELVLFLSMHYKIAAGRKSQMTTDMQL
jgi:hypothetical protein